jgi:hypothetical protein
LHTGHINVSATALSKCSGAWTVPTWLFTGASYLALATCPTPVPTSAEVSYYPREGGRGTEEVDSRSGHSSAFGLGLSIGRDEADLPRRGDVVAAVLLGRRVAHCEQMVIRGHSTSGTSPDPDSMTVGRSLSQMGGAEDQRNDRDAGEGLLRGAPGQEANPWTRVWVVAEVVDRRAVRW